MGFADRTVAILMAGIGLWTGGIGCFDLVIGFVKTLIVLSRHIL